MTIRRRPAARRAAVGAGAAASRRVAVLRTGLWIIAAAGGLLIAPGLWREAHAGGNIEDIVTISRTSYIVDAVWDAAHALPIRWKINDRGVIQNCDQGNPDCVGGISPITLQRAVDAMTSAFNTWQAVPTSRIAFTYTGTTAVGTIGSDGINLITWADGGLTNCPDYVVATTPHSYVPADMTVSSSNRDLNADGIIDLDPAIYPDGTLLKAGTIYDADVAWCPLGNDFVDHPLDTSTYTFDIVAVATHELGHFFGLSHSSLIQPMATMLPFVTNTAAFAEDFRVLATDDMATASRYYPETGAASGFGTITGQLYLPGGTVPADGASITAFNVSTGEMTAQTFSASRFLRPPASLPAGAFRLDWLPPGTYFVGIEFFDSTTGMNGGGDDDWWDNNRYNLTIYNGVSGVNSSTIARPEWYSSPENGTDDLADQLAVTVGPGQTLNVGTITINTTSPPAPSGATHLNLGNDNSLLVTFPTGFTFPFFGTSWGGVYANANGSLTFGAASPSPNSRNFLGPDAATGGPVPPRIALPLVDLDPSLDNQGQAGGALDVFSRFVSDSLGDRMEFIWLGTPMIATTKSNTIVVRLFRDGRIEIRNYFVSAWWGVEGVCPGGNGTEPSLEVDFSRQVPFAGGVGQATYEHFAFAQPTSAGGSYLLGHAFDLNGATLLFTPNAQGGYEVSSSTLIGGPPREILNLRFTGDTTLQWDARGEANAYNAYRGALGSFTDADHDGAADAYGACLDASLPTTMTSDGSVPATGVGYFYLVSGRNPAGEGTLGNASSGAPRPNVAACP